MELTKNSISIPNIDTYLFRLELDDIMGIIRLTKNNLKHKETRITDRNIPVTEGVKWQFHKNRSGYSDNPYNEYGFIGSYIDRQKDPATYNEWKTYLINKYRELRDANKGQKRGAENA